MDTCKGLGDDGTASQMTGFQGGMFARRTFTVVFITDGHPADALGLVETSHVRNSSPFAGDLVLDLVHLVVLDVGGTEHEKQT